ncbi:Crp/Fnr family transcriptional regulator [Hydrogenivirga sp. 128-5-R1-1]|uniref:Crp/Fnr family transcriptional regulator n=1 Tax=Hydrogenivirga sp. 128-5-R1-1 TaxID=392423 RepID=UPI00015EF868|nr:Crp/Fnr family transcriptional regulator [Hydrogenivirga sp. 128-5-R1-1]EDP75610.1 cAMP-dependent transcriptional regulator [Hydrogenivirga sp. 128-5-R1-1]
MGETGKLVDFLKRSVLFQNLPESDLRKISLKFKFIDLPMGEVLFYEKDESSDMYLVIEGKVRASLFDEHGNELVLAELGPGEFLGEMSMIDGLPRSATVIAEEPTKLAVLSREAFLKILRENPDMSVNVIRALVARLRRTDDMVEALAFRNVESRIVKFLLEVGRERGVMESGKFKVRKMTHRDLASRVGSSREAVTKALKALTFKGVIEDSGNFWLVSPDAEEEIDP